MKKFIHLRSSIPSKVAVNGEPVPSNSDIVCNKDFYIAFFPYPEDFTPCAISTSGSTNQNIKFIPYYNNHLEIIYTPNRTPNKKNETIILNKKYLNYFFMISNSNNSYINITSKSFNHSSTCAMLKTVEFKTKEEYVFIFGHISDKKQYLLIFNTKSHKIIVEDIYSYIECTKTLVKAIKQNDSKFGYCKVVEFNLTNKTHKFYNLTNKNKASTHQISLLPYQFLECLKYCDYKGAIDCLNEKTTTPEKLKSYFGNIKEIYYNGYSDDINYTVLSDEKYRSFSFQIENDKIIDIEEKEL